MLVYKLQVPVTQEPVTIDADLYTVACIVFMHQFMLSVQVCVKTHTIISL